MPRDLVFVIFDQFQILDLTGPLAAFEAASAFAGGAYTATVAAADGGAVASSSGLEVNADPFLLGPCDTFLVCGGDGTRAAVEDERLLAYVRAQAALARRTGSICSGSLVLAAAGLLDGRRATSHWSRIPGMQKRYPRVRVEPDSIFVKDGTLWTSAGITAGIDMALALIEEDLGAGVAAKAAQELVVYHRRPGGQSQFSALLELQPAGEPSARALAFAREHLREPLSVEQLADAAGLSPRQFARRFLAETGQTPAKAVERLRVEAARSEVEVGALSIEVIARRSGFGDPERMRRAFMRTLGQPPQALRRQARFTARPIGDPIAAE